MNPTLFGNRGFCIIGGMMRVLLLVLLCAVVHAAELRIPSVPPPAFADTESVTNAPLGRALETSRFLRVRIELTATPSNNVEVAFGTEEGAAFRSGAKPSPSVGIAARGSSLRRRTGSRAPPARTPLLARSLSRSGSRRTERPACGRSRPSVEVRSQTFPSARPNGVFPETGRPSALRSVAWTRATRPSPSALTPIRGS